MCNRAMHGVPVDRIAFLVILPTVISLLLIPSVATSQGYPDGMIAYWKFDEGEGSVAYDSLGDKNGAVHGATWTDGQVNSALSFSGGDVVQVPYYAEWNTGPTLSVEVWFNLRSQSYWAQIVGRDGYGCPVPFRGWYLGLASDRDDLTLNVLNEPPIQSNVFSPMFTIAYDQWYHAVGVYDGENVRLFVNGQEVGAGTPRTGVVNPSDIYGITIGSDHSCFPFPVDGVIDEVAIYSRALTPDEIHQHYENGLLGVGYEARLTCGGFERPMDAGPVTVRGRTRSLPFQAELFNLEGVEMTGSDLVDPPVIQVMYSSDSQSDPVDVSSEALPAGAANEGNQFVFVDESRWQYILSLAKYTAPGTYTVTIVSGDSGAYAIIPSCEGVFVVD